MFERIVLLAVIVGAAYWYWAGPYQDRINPDYEAVLKQNDENMAQCTRGAAYKFGATGSGTDPETAERECSEKYNVYKLDGHWHSYGMSRPD